MPISYINNNEFQRICEAGDLSGFRQILSEDPDLKNLNDVEIWEGLVQLVSNEHANLINFCLTAEKNKIKSFLAPSYTMIDISNTHNGAFFPCVQLLLACVNLNWTKTAALLVKSGVNIHAGPCVGQNNQSAVELALREGRPDILAVFLELGSWEAQQKDAALETALSLNGLLDQQNKFTINYLKLITLLLKHKANFKPQNNEKHAEAFNKLVYGVGIALSTGEIDIYIHRPISIPSKLTLQPAEIEQLKKEIRKLIKEMILTAEIDIHSKFIIYSNEKIDLVTAITQYLNPVLVETAKDWQADRHVYNIKRKVKNQTLFFTASYREQLSLEKQNLPNASSSLVGFQLG